MAKSLQSRQSGAAWTTVLLITLVAVASTASVAVLISWRPAPTVLQPTQAQTGSITVSRLAYDDAREVELTVTQGASSEVVATASGIITSSSCRPGAGVVSGKPIATVGARDVVPLATSIPLYRPVTVGATGADVDSLRAELGRLRLTKSQAAGTPADAQLVGAGRKLAGLIGRSALSTATNGRAAAELPAAAFAWLPTTTATVASCDAAVGSTVAVGTPLLTLRPPVTALSVLAVPAGAVQGDRLLTVDPVTVALVDGGVTAAADIARLAKTPAWAAYEQTAGKVPVRGRWKLKTPLAVASLPAASLIVTSSNESDARACVSVNGRAVPVRIVASSLGRTLVTFTGTLPDAVDTTPAQTLSCG